MKKLYQLLLFINVLAFLVYGQQIKQINYDKIGGNLRFILHTQKGRAHLLPVPNMSAIPGEPDKIGVVIWTNSPDDLIRNGININSRYQNFVTARLTIDDIIKSSNIKSVNWISAGEDFQLTNDVAGGISGSKLLNEGYVNNTNYTGSGILLCIIDSGIDFKHLDFREPGDTTKSRIIYLWDQTLTKTGSEKTPQDRDPANLWGLNYGVEYTTADINNEIDGTPAGFVREKDIIGHGSHVCGTAGGNGSALSTNKYAGIAPETDLLIIKGGSGSYISPNHTIDALTYINAISDQLGKPVVVNMSFGDQINAHDGTSAVDQAINQFTGGGSGRVVVVSAGNEGNELMHITGSVSGGSTSNINFSVPSYTASTGPYNDYFYFHCWCDINGDVTASIITPNNYTVTAPSNILSTMQTNDGYVYLNNSLDNINNNRKLDVNIYDRDELYPPVHGIWDIAITNNTSATMIYHGWLTTKSLSMEDLSMSGADNHYVIGSPGDADNAITVGAYATRWSWYGSDDLPWYLGTPNRSDNIAEFSSIGPRRDGVQKPDIAAPGEMVISVKSSSSFEWDSDMISGNLYCIKAGTSMSSPVVAGSAALLLEAIPNLNYNQVKSYIISNAVTDTYTGTVPNYTWGYGKLNVFKAMIDLVNHEWPKDFAVLKYDQWGVSQYYNIDANEKFAVRFTPDFSGKISGAFIRIYSKPNLTGPLYMEVWSDNGGLPGSKLGSTVTIDQNSLGANTWNYIDMCGADVEVSEGSDFHLVSYFSSGDETGFVIDVDENDGRSSVDKGSGWLGKTFDFRIRALITPSESALPVQLASFNAENIDGKVSLIWETENEVDNYGFEIERQNIEEQIKSGEKGHLSLPEDQWRKIGFVKGSGNSNSPKHYSFVDKSVQGNGFYFYRLKQIDNNGKTAFSDAVEVMLSKPTVFALEQNYPNPFNPVSTIRFTIPKESHVVLKLFDVLGREIKTIIDEEKKAGVYTTVINADNLSSGVYLYKLTAGKYTQVKKMMVLK